MNKILTQRAADILVVAGDIEAFGQVRRPLQRVRFSNRLHHVGDAIEAKAYLRREGPYLHAPTPGLVLFDAGLARASVIDLITELKTNPQFSGIALIALVDTDSEIQLLNECAYGVDACIHKPFDFGEFFQATATIQTLSFVLMQSPFAG